MDNLVLIRVADVLDSALRHAVLAKIQSEGLHRWRLVFESGGHGASLLVSLRPELPWIGRPALRSRTRARRSDPFAGSCRRALRGAVLERVDKPSSDRILHFRFGDGRALVAELATHGANLVLLGPHGEVVAAARHPRSARKRLEPGTPYHPPRLPARMLDPRGVAAHEIDAFLRRIMDDGESLLEAIRRHVFGIGTEGARLIEDETGRSGRSAGEILTDRLAGLHEGRLDPVVLAEEDPIDLAKEGRLDLDTARLLPWEPEPAPDGLATWKRRDAAGTAGLYHGAVEHAAATAARLEGLGGVLKREIRRMWEVETKVAADIEGFEDPDRYRRWGEAILAGLGDAERFGEHVRVPDPYEPGRDLVIPAPPGTPLPQVAESHFRRCRRARRGLETARDRHAKVAARRSRLEALLAAAEGARGDDGADQLEASMRREAIPVGLVRSEPARGADSTSAPVRIEGVRLFLGSQGDEILVGRTSRGNERLTFKIAGPEDFWLHALDRPGAHVVIRNPQRRSRPPKATLEEAAALAAWFSDAREEGQAEVQWTRRRNVRRIRGGPPGVVTVKRFESLRVRPALLEG